jgi:hypothetical protein
MNSISNKTVVFGHAGPHPEGYHQAVYNALIAATQGLEGDEYRKAFLNQLHIPAVKIATPGTDLNGSKTVRGRMLMKYYVLVDDKRIRGRWYLKGPIRSPGEPLDPRTFTAGKSLDVSQFSNLAIPLRRCGRPLDFTLADFDMPVMRADLAGGLERRCSGDVQLIPARVEGTPGDYSIVNFTQTVACLDEKRSGVTWWTPGDGRPEKVGQYMIVAHPQVDGTRVNGQLIFRIRGWENAIVVSEEIADLFSSKLGPVLQPA